MFIAQTISRSETLLFEVNSNEYKDSRLFKMLRINEYSMISPKLDICTTLSGAFLCAQSISKLIWTENLPYYLMHYVFRKEKLQSIITE